jgi:pimeloyl-ACP methyl ester carboxylesterase
MRRRLFFLGAEDDAQLVGSVDEPEGEPRSVIVLGPSGLQARAGANRAYVRLARALAARGHRVVRCDLRGLGEAGSTLPERHITGHWQAIESGLFLADFKRLLEHARGEAGGAPIVAAGLCGGGLTSALAAAELPWVAGVYAIGVPFVRMNQRIPAGMARENQRMRAWRELHRRRAHQGGARYRKALRLLVFSFLPRRRLRGYDEAANQWLNLPLVRALERLHRERRPIELVYGEFDVAKGQLEEFFFGPFRLGPTPSFVVTRAANLGHQLDSPEEVERIIDQLDAFAAGVAAGGPGRDAARPVPA